MDQTDDSAPSTMAFQSGVTPQSTTAELAKDAPLENKRPSGIPGAFPETPGAVDIGSEGPFGKDKDEPAAPGGFPMTPAEEQPQPAPAALTKPDDSASKEPERGEASVASPEPAKEAGRDSGADTAEAEPSFGVNPLPATAGSDNPIDLRPGEKVPHPSSFTTGNINSAVTLDKESYERSGSTPFLPPVVTPQEERDRKGTGVLGLPPITNTLIPESSLPMGGEAPSSEKDPGVHISSAAPESSTAALAAQVPLEPRRDVDDAPEVPEVVKESIEKAHFDPEATASAEAVREKHEVEEELEREVKPIPPTTEGVGQGTATTGPIEPAETTQASTAPGDEGIPEGQGPAAISTGPDSTADMPQVTADDTPGAGQDFPRGQDAGEGVGQPAGGAAKLPSSIVQSIQQMNLAADKGTATTADVPDVVTRSMDQAHESPEAAANAEAVVEKREVERELLQEVKPTEAAGEPAPTQSAALSPFAPGPTTQAAPQPGETSAPDTTERSAPNLHKELPIVDDARRSMAAAPPAQDGLNASAASPAVPPVTQEAAAPPTAPKDTAPVTQETAPAPVVTTGVDSSTTERQSTPQKAAAPAPVTSSSSTPHAGPVAAESPSSTQSKKEKRRSGFFGKLKEKLKR